MSKLPRSLCFRLTLRRAQRWIGLSGSAVPCSEAGVTRKLNPFLNKCWLINDKTTTLLFKFQILSGAFFCNQSSTSCLSTLPLSLFT